MSENEKNKNVLGNIFYKELKYYPMLQDLQITYFEQGLWFMVYLSFWGLLFYLNYKTKRIVYAKLGGFLIGLLILGIEFYIYNKPSWIIINNNNGRMYSLNTEGSTDPELPASDWMVYTNDKLFPNSKRYSYLIPYDKLKGFLNKGITDLIPLNVIFDGYFKKYINYGSQDDIGFFSDRNNRLGENSFYISILALTLGLYLVQTKYYKVEVLYWILLSIIISITGGTLMGNANNVSNANYILFLKRKLLTFAISVTATAVFMS
jgi:hypothetical protein|tara:strand:- start:4329 stop:5117 length:789 start_codon:yes stop_codon:yes gene_type:complete